MSVKLYMDENVPRQITLGLRLRGLDVLTVQEDSRLGLPDPQVLDRATELQRVLFSRDDDLLVIANQRQHNGTPFYLWCDLRSSTREQHWKLCSRSGTHCQNL
jgi:predicted nuclease of predicted toxin-antitoxin system